MKYFIKMVNYENIVLLFNYKDVVNMRLLFYD